MGEMDQIEAFSRGCRPFHSTCGQSSLQPIAGVSGNPSEAYQAYQISAIQQLVKFAPKPAPCQWPPLLVGRPVLEPDPQVPP
jgi:hypothetical protein